MAPSRSFLGLALLVLALVAGALAGTPASADPPSVQLVTLDLGPDGRLRVVDAVPAPGIGLADAAPAGADTVTVEVVGTDGRVDYRSRVAVDDTIRAEFPARAGSDELSHERVPGQGAFTVALPIGAGDRVRVTDAGRSSTAAAVPARKRADEPVVVPLPGYPAADPANRVDLVILGDGYTAAEQADFAADAAAVADGLLDIAPYSTYAGFLNVVGVFAPSAQSGADHPPYQDGCAGGTTHPITCCPDPTAPASGTYRTTRYESSYCYYGIQRLMVPTNEGQVYADATAAYPAWDQLLLVVNDPEYGGSGGAIATTSTDPSGVEVMRHELGHSLLWLDDEYADDTPGYPGCTDVARRPSLGPCQANVTDATTRGTLKWRRWVKASTPIPTRPPTPSSVVGLFLGAHYSSDTYYRSCDECLMRYLQRPFGSVAAEQLPVRLYAGGWQGPAGAGSGRIELVEPGSASPSTSAPLSVAAGATQTFSAQVLAPTAGPGTRVRWVVDGVEVSSSVVTSGPVHLDWVSPDGGDHTVRLEVADVAGVLHPTLSYQSLAHATWTIGTGGPRELLTNGGFELPLGRGWTRSHVATSDRLCRADVARSGQCAVRLSASRSTARRLTSAPDATAATGDELTLRAAVDPDDLRADARVIAVVELAGGTTQRLTLAGFPQDRKDRRGYLTRETSITLAGDVTNLQVRVQIARGRGTVLVDAVSLLLRKGAGG
ncbi:M64 family metallopeptidase [Nocardioides sp. SR21]|uniref:M64 family metallopeptidase n=1 Tax=Nocardioides sp. SR21 TaxID=2919501 RepID=UPI001FA972D5|nr:M64 family metallopeptidase [Nocardioides sp. SR21]